MDYSALTCKAVLDWVEYEIQLSRPCTHSEVLAVDRHNIRFAEHQNQDATGQSTCFRIRYHDLERWEQLDALVLVLHREIGLVPYSNDPADLHRVVRLELTLDFRLKDQKNMPEEEIKTQLTDVLAHLVHGWTTKSDGPDGEKRRLAGYLGKKKTADGLSNLKAYRSGFRAGRVFVAFDQDSPAMPRAYIKTDTAVGNDRRRLNKTNWSARTERSNIEIDDPQTTPAGVHELALEDFADLFKFRQNDENASQSQQNRNEANSAIGKQRERVFNRGDKNRRTKRKNHPGTKASPVNRMAYDALRSLTKRLNREKKSARADFAEITQLKPS